MSNQLDLDLGAEVNVDQLLIDLLVAHAKVRDTDPVKKWGGIDHSKLEDHRCAVSNLRNVTVKCNEYLQSKGLTTGYSTPL